MIRIAMIQMFYKPALVDNGVDYLAEPGVCDGHMSAFTPDSSGNTGYANDLLYLRTQIHDDYISHIKFKIQQLCDYMSVKVKPDIIVFPEYSIPYQCLPMIQNLAVNYNMTIIAGSHTVSNLADDYYFQAHMPNGIPAQYKGFSIAPVFTPDGKSDFQVKHYRSNYEITMCEDECSNLKTFTIVGQDKDQYTFSVIICVDAIVPRITGMIKDQQMIFIMACSPVTESFCNLSKQMAFQSIPIIICNDAQYGNTGIVLSEHVRSKFSNIPGENSFIDRGKEEIMILDVNVNHFFTKRAVLDKTIIGHFDKMPVIYKKGESWDQEYINILEIIQGNIKENDILSAIDHAQYFVDTYQQRVPKGILDVFENFITRLSESGDVNIPSTTPLELPIIEGHSTSAHFYNECQLMLNFAVQTDDVPLDLIGNIRDKRKKYNKEALLPITSVTPEILKRQPPTEEQIRTFRDRGEFMNELERAMNDKTVRLILLSGSYGTGKTSLVETTFKKNLINWKMETISLPKVRFSMALEYIADIIGDTLRADTLIRYSKKILKPIMKKFVEKLFDKSGRVIVVDNIESIFNELQGKDHTLLTLFREAVCERKCGDGKLIFISDIRFPTDIFIEDGAIKRIALGGIHDSTYITHILKYEMRRHGMESPGNEIDIPDYIYELVHGHPLTAKLCIDVAAQKGLASLSDISRNQMQQHIVEHLMKEITLNDSQTRIIQILCVFRITVDINRLLRFLSPEHKNLIENNLNCLDRLSFVVISGNSIEIASVFRSYYYDQIPIEQYESYHDYALKYYININEELSKNHQFSSMIYAEIAYHLTCLNRISELIHYLPGNFNTIKLLAKGVYQHKEYNSALNLYQILEKANPEDTEVLTYLGRCHARMKNWILANEFFDYAISEAIKHGEDTWYIYRDWGHMYAISRSMAVEAGAKFEKAREMLLEESHGQRTDDAGILAAEGYMKERDGDDKGAVEKYEAALELTYDHEFTISHYTELLRRRGDFQQATELETRLLNGKLERFNKGTEFTERYLSDIEFIDFDEDSHDN